METKKRVLIVGGVAAGASAAARLRRMDETCEIVLFDKGKYVSFANCGLPYYVGDVILDEKKLLLATPQLFQERFNIQVKVEHEVTKIDRAAKTIEVKSAQGVTREPYDVLVLAPGAAPLRPPLPGLDLPGIFVVRNIPDTRLIRGWIESKQAKRAVVVGAGFIGLEMAENLKLRGLEVTILEAGLQALPPLDPEMAVFVHQHLKKHGVDLQLGDPVASFVPTASGLSVRTKAGQAYGADLVIFSIGVKPETALAKAAGIELGSLGGIKVDDQMRTSDPSIFAVGDVVEVKDFVTGLGTLIPLAGPANRQGRLVADAIAGKPRSFRGVQATAVCGFFGLTAALTGATEKTLKRAGITDYGRVYLHPGNHAAYYPGAKPIHMKLLFDRKDGRVLGAQAVGEEGVEKRIDVLAMAIQMKAQVRDLEEAELCYAPQFGAAKDPINVAGMIASNLQRWDVVAAPWEGLADPGTRTILDVRDPQEFKAGHLDGAVNIPLNDLRARMGELDKSMEVWVNCGVGQRSYYAVRTLRQNGFNAQNLPGGYQTYRMFHPVD